MIKRTAVVFIVVTLMVALSNACASVSCCDQMPKCPMKNCNMQDMSFFAKIGESIKIQLPVAIDTKPHREINPFLTGSQSRYYLDEIAILNQFVFSSPQLFIKDLVLLI